MQVRTLFIKMGRHLNPKWKTQRRNDILDLSQEVIRFNIDHLHRLPHTTKSFVFFPYHIYVDEVNEFNKYCKSKGYRVEFVGGESVYGGRAEMTNGTMTVLLIHEDDENPDPRKFLSDLDAITRSPQFQQHLDQLGTSNRG